jgi:S-adenosylmethionine uptake transporter
LYKGKESIKSFSPYIHIARGALLFFGIASWTYGLVLVPITTATTVSFAVPLFTLILALFFLSEKIIWQRWVAVIVGFCGIIIAIDPKAADFNPQVLIFILASMAFATLDIINKKFVIKESMLSMLFYSAMVTTILSVVPMILYWQTPTMMELLLLFILGCSASSILFFLLKACAIVDATALAPYRYFELVISSIGGYCIFNEFPTNNTIYGALIVIPSTLFVIYSEKKNIDKDKLKI